MDILNSDSLERLNQLLVAFFFSKNFINQDIFPFYHKQSVKRSV